MLCFYFAIEVILSNLARSGYFKYVVLDGKNGINYVIQTLGRLPKEIIENEFNVKIVMDEDINDEVCKYVINKIEEILAENEIYIDIRIINMRFISFHVHYCEMNMYFTVNLVNTLDNKYVYKGDILILDVNSALCIAERMAIISRSSYKRDKTSITMDKMRKNNLRYNLLREYISNISN